MDDLDKQQAELADIKKDTSIYSIAQFVKKKLTSESEIRQAKSVLAYTLGNKAFSILDGDKFIIKNKKLHFEHAFDMFKKLCTLGCDIRLSEFTEQGFINYFVREIGLVMNDSAETWVYYDDMVIPFDRYLRAKPDGTEFYIGSIFVYEKDVNEVINI